MTRKDYKVLAQVMGEAFAAAAAKDGEDTDDARTLVYDTVYIPLCTALMLDNPNFSQTQFSFACAVAEGKAMEDRLNA